MIHSSAIIDPSAKLADDVEVGPWTIVGPNVEIGAGCKIASHVVIKGPTTIGCHNQIFQFSSVGEDTADMKYKGEATRLEIGDHNIIREGVTIHRGTIQDRGVTSIGDHNLLMAYVHIGHDSMVGNHTVLVNNAALAGHVVIGDWAILGGYTLVHQFCQIGSHSFCGMGTAVGKDVPAYMMVSGNPASVYNINAEGLRRRGYSADSLRWLKRAYKAIYRQGLTLEDALIKLEEMASECEEMRLLIDSLQQSSRGIVR